MACKDIIVVGASAGGMDALTKLVAGLPERFAGSVFVVWHMAPGVKRSMLPELLSRAGPLPASTALDGEAIKQGRIYVAPSDHHMLLERGYVRVTKGPKENRFRPALDPLFRSAAYIYGPRVVGVVLTGALDDGTAGLWTIKLRGGTAVVQDPEEASMSSMPLSALSNVEVDHTLPVSDIGPLLGALAREEAAQPLELPDDEKQKSRQEILIAQEQNALEENVMRFGELSPLTCPECHGVLTQLREGRIVRFRCHTGHAFSPAALLDSGNEQFEARLYEAVRTLDETVMLLNTMGEEFAKAGELAAAERCFQKARESHNRAEPIRQVVARSEGVNPELVA